MDRQYHPSNLMSEVPSNRILDAAFHDIHQKRLNDSPHSDIWALSPNWENERAHIRERLLSTRYSFDPVQTHSTRHGFVSRWNAQDAIVQKAIAMIVDPIIQSAVGVKCFHLKGHGGLKGAVRQLGHQLKKSTVRFVIKSDVASFYDSMHHDTVMDHCETLIKDPRVLDLIQQYLQRVDVYQAEHRLVSQGIAKGCPLSPLVGALILKSLDACIPDDVFYARYMDDWVILLKSRHACRRHVKKMHGVMRALHFKLALDKTFIGRIERGFDFLGYRFNAIGIIGLARKTVLNFIERLIALYEQKASEARLRQYVRRWVGWCLSGL